MSTQKQCVSLIAGPTDRLFGAIKAPPSKSYTHRAIIVGSLSKRARVINPLYSEDTRSTMAIWRKLGADIEKDREGLTIRGCDGVPRPAGRSINVGESGTLLRFILSILALAKGSITVNGRGTLLDRTNRQIVDVLRAWGVEISGRGNEHCLPIHVTARGLLKGGKAKVEGSVTSQVISSLLIAAPFAHEDTVLSLPKRLVSRPYVDVTMDVLRWAGVHVDRKGYKVFKVAKGQKVAPKSTFIVHGDYSSAAFPLVAAALLESRVTVTDLVKDCQGDSRILGILRAMGARVSRSGDAIAVNGPFKLRGIDVDGSDIPDLVPVMAVLGCFAEGRMRIRNVAHLVHKESNRLARPAGELKKLGARISFTKDELIIRHSKLHSGKVSSCNDHRIVMALAVAGMKIDGGVSISGAECIAKSYPGFVSDMRKLHANMQLVRR